MEVDWSSLFAVDTPVLETVVRGSVMYLAIFLLLRVIIRRPTGNRSMSELLVVVLLADAAQNGLADDYASITSGILLVATIMGWNWALDSLASRIPWMERLVTPSPLPVVRRGQPIQSAMRRQNLSMDELRMLLRLRGVDDISRVEEARMEALGGISFRLRDEDGPQDQESGPADPTANI